MSNSIEEALSKAVKQVEVGEVVQEPAQQLSNRVKVLLARKKNLQRKKRQHIPKKLR